MRRYNQHLYRVVISMARDAGESEKVMQDAYVRAFQHLAIRPSRPFSIWLVHEALAPVRSRNRIRPLDNELGDVEMFPKPQVILRRPPAGPSASRSARTGLVNLPESYRAVLMLHDVEENQHSRNGRGP